jgi:hypothetical protein
MLMEKASSAAQDVDLFVLAQGSMARLQDSIAAAVGKPVLSSPKLGVERVKEVMRKCGRVSPSSQMT